MKATNTILKTASFYSYQGGYIKVLISPEETSGSMALFELTMPRGGEPPKHLHTLEEETFYILEGELEFYLGESVATISPCDVIFAPRNIVHGFRILTNHAKILTLITPGDFLNHFRESGNEESGETELVPPSGPPPQDVVEKLAIRLAERFGVYLKL